MHTKEIALIYKNMLFDAQQAPRLRSEDLPQWSYLMHFIPNDESSHILDAGCGNGKYCVRLSERGYRNITGIDLFESVDTQGVFHYQPNSIEVIDLPDNSVAFAYCFSVIYYLPDPASGLKELHRVLRSGAKLLLSAHTKYSLFTAERVVRRAFGDSKHLRDVHFRSAGQYIKMLKSVGFNILDVDGYRLVWLPPIIETIMNQLPLISKSNPGRADDRMPRIDRTPRFLKKLRSVFGYHCLIAAQKR